MDLISKQFQEILMKKLEEVDLEASGKIESIQDQWNKEKQTAIRTIEQKTQLIESEYLKIEEHEKIVNGKINAIT